VELEEGLQKYVQELTKIGERQFADSDQKKQKRVKSSSAIKGCI
jgi:ribosomal protein S18